MDPPHPSHHPVDHADGPAGDDDSNRLQAAVEPPRMEAPHAAPEPLGFTNAHTSLDASTRELDSAG